MGKPDNLKEYLIEAVDGLDIYVSRRLEIGDNGFRIIQAGIVIKRLEVHGIRII